MTVTTILGVDPGKMTGFSLYDLTSMTFTGAWELPMDEFLDWAHVTSYTLPPGNLEVACENFHITVHTAKKSQGERQWSLEQIGVLRWLSRQYGHHLVLTSPSDAKRFCTDEKLRNAAMYTTGRGHANDSTRQIVHALGRRGIAVGVTNTQ